MSHDEFQAFVSWCEAAGLDVDAEATAEAWEQELDERAALAAEWRAA